MGGAAAPFALGAGPDACLLLHGLTGSPAEVRPVGEALAAMGLRVVGPLLPGHGTDPEDLATVTRGELLDAARGALLSLAGCRRLFICGLSAGALLSLELAARTFLRDGLPDVSGLVLLAPAVEFSGLTWVFANVLGRLPTLPLVIAKGGRDLQQKPLDTDDRRLTRDDGSYGAIPLRWGHELLQLRNEALKVAPRIHAPALLLHGALDRTTTPAGSRRLCRTLRKADLRIFERSGHILPLDVEGAAVIEAVCGFVREKQQGERDGQVRPRD